LNYNLISPIFFSKKSTQNCNLLELNDLSTGTSASSAAKRDFLQYALSLMRSHSDEHADELPALELGVLRHVSYVLDAALYHLANALPLQTASMPSN